MRKILLSIFISSAFCFSAYSQKFARYDDFPRDFGVGVGIMGAVGSSTSNVGAEAFYSFSASHFNLRGLGYRFGVRYAGYLAGLEDVLNLPVAFAYRTGMRNFDDALTDEAYNIFLRDWYYTRESSVSSILLSSLVFLFRQTEFNVGLTPGLIFGDSHIYTVTTMYNEQYLEGVNKRSSFLLTADLGFQFNLPIWRFCITLSPGLHYVLTNNFQLVRRYDTSNIRWLFSGMAGIKFAF